MEEEQNQLRIRDIDSYHIPAARIIRETTVVIPVEEGVDDDSESSTADKVDVSLDEEL